MTVLARRRSQFAEDVRRGLTGPGQKQLPASYLYDEVGSALFEVITLIPEYGLTRADTRLLRRHAPDIARAVSPGAIVAELGSGTGTKTRYVLEGLDTKPPSGYYPIDVSAAALRACATELSAVAPVYPVNASYLDGLRRVTAARRPGQEILLLFLGSTIGNFERDAALSFLGEVRALLQPGDAMLIGADLVKSEQIMLLAYDDPAGVTAAFNKNLLARMNRELRARFDLRQFVHQAHWNSSERRIEMRLSALSAQIVPIPEAELTVRFSAGETIWTESSHKFETGELPRMAQSAGFEQEACWIDAEWAFAECLWRV